MATSRDARLQLKIARGDRIGIVGPNGAGKTTLINLLTGALPPDSGTVHLGTNLEIATLDQKRESLDPEASVATILTGGSGDQVIIDGEPRHVIGYMKDFLFKPEQARTPVKALSGGERGRLMLGPRTGATRPISWCWTSRPTISISRRSTSCRRCSPPIRARSSSSATTATSSIAPSPR